MNMSFTLREAISQKGDVLFGLSTSGNSKNILNAIKAAQRKRHESDCVMERRVDKWQALRILRIRDPHFGYADHVRNPY